MYKEPLTLEQRVERLEATIASGARNRLTCSIPVKDLVEIVAAMERADAVLSDGGAMLSGESRSGLANAKKAILAALNA